MIRKFITVASQEKISSGKAYDFISTLLTILWIGGILFIVKPVFEMVAALPTYIESSRLQDSPQDGYLRLGKYDEGLMRDMNQHSLRASNSWGYIEDGLINIIYYFLFLFLLPFILLRLASTLI